MEVRLRRLLGEAPAGADRHRDRPRAVARRVAVIGTSGSGKTTVSAELARRLGVPHVELDALHHGPNWTAAPADEFRSRVEDVLAADGWVADGNYHSKLGDLVLERAEVVVWLDLPLRTCLRRVLRRTVARIRDDVELWSGNRESWRGGFFGWNALIPWTIRSHIRRRLTWARRFERFDVVRLRSQEEVDAWLARYV